jgi:molybdate transport system permease protein
MTFDRTPLWVSLSLAGMVSIISVCTMTPLAWYAVKRPGPLTRILDILLVVPMSLPPTVLGFYFLLLLSPSSPLGRIFEWFGISLLFSFPGLVLACSVAYSPYLYRTLRDSFVKIEPDLWNASLLPW